MGDGACVLRPPPPPPPPPPVGGAIAASNTAFISTADGFHIVFYVSPAMPTWQAQAAAEVEDDLFINQVEEMFQRYQLNVNGRAMARHVARLQ